MLQQVRDQRPSHNNRGAISSSVSVSSLKLLYYRLFAGSYSLVGSCAHRVMVNSSWTQAHIAELWGGRTKKEQTAAKLSTKASVGKGSKDTIVRDDHSGLNLVFPPCNTTDLHCKMELRRESRVNGERLVVSIGQFRPEKDHFLQLRLE